MEFACLAWNWSISQLQLLSALLHNNILPITWGVWEDHSFMLLTEEGLMVMDWSCRWNWIKFSDRIFHWRFNQCRAEWKKYAISRKYSMCQTVMSLQILYFAGHVNLVTSIVNWMVYGLYMILMYRAAQRPGADSRCTPPHPKKKGRQFYIF